MLLPGPHVRPSQDNPENIYSSCGSTYVIPALSSMASVKPVWATREPTPVLSPKPPRCQLQRRGTSNADGFWERGAATVAAGDKATGKGSTCGCAHPHCAELFRSQRASGAPGGRRCPDVSASRLRESWVGLGKVCPDCLQVPADNS